MAISINAQGEHVDELDAVLDELRAVFAKAGWLAAEAAVTDENGTRRENLMPAPAEPAADDEPSSSSASTSSGAFGAPPTT